MLDISAWSLFVLKWFRKCFPMVRQHQQNGRPDVAGFWMRTTFHWFRSTPASWPYTGSGTASHKGFMTSQFNFERNIISLLLEKYWSDEVTILHRSRQLRCRDLCKCVTWLDYQNYNYKKRAFKRFQSWPHRPFLFSNGSLFINTHDGWRMHTCHKLPTFKRWWLIALYTAMDRCIRAYALIMALKTGSCYHANFVLSVDSGGCLCDNHRCHQLLQSWHQEDSLISVKVIKSCN